MEKNNQFIVANDMAKPAKKSKKHYVDIPALRNGNSIEIEKTSQNWNRMNQRQKDKIRHEIPRSIYETVISKTSSVINSSNNTTRKAGQYLTHKVETMYGNLLRDTDSSDNPYMQWAMMEKIDRLHERESRAITERHKESQENIKDLFTVGTIATLGYLAFKLWMSKK